MTTTVTQMKVHYREVRKRGRSTVTSAEADAHLTRRAGGHPHPPAGAAAGMAGRGVMFAEVDSFL